MVMGNNPFGSFMPAVRNNSDALLQAGIGLLSGRTANEQAAMGLQGFAQGRKMNMTLDYLDKNYPEFAQAARAGVLTPSEALMQANASRTKKGPIQINGKLVDPETYQVLADFSSSREQDETFFGNPIPVQNPDGTVSYGQIGNRGTFRPIQIGEGQTFAPPVKTVDTGTGTALIGPGGVSVGNINKDIAGAAAQKEIGSAQGAAAASAPGDIQAGMNALDIVNSIRNDPNKAWGTGGTSVFNAIPGTPGKDFQTKVDQATSGAFLTAIQQMRGLGALSNAEGGAATAAITRMNTATSEQAFNEALNDYEKIIRQGIARAQSRMPDGAAGATDYKTKYGLD